MTNETPVSLLSPGMLLQPGATMSNCRSSGGRKKRFPIDTTASIFYRRYIPGHFYNFTIEVNRCRQWSYHFLISFFSHHIKSLCFLFSKIIIRIPLFVPCQDPFYGCWLCQWNTMSCLQFHFGLATNRTIVWNRHQRCTKSWILHWFIATLLHFSTATSLPSCLPMFRPASTGLDHAFVACDLNPKQKLPLSTTGPSASIWVKSHATNVWARPLEAGQI